jgi:hypothetical protein
VTDFQPLKIPARNLLPGDQVGSGETVVKVSAGVRTPRGKVEVTLQKGEHSRFALWGAHTVINVSRPLPIAPVAVKVETLGLILSDLASLALSVDCAALAAHDAALSSSLTTLQLICSTCVADPRREVKHQP